MISSIRPVSGRRKTRRGIEYIDLRPFPRIFLQISQNIVCGKTWLERKVSSGESHIFLKPSKLLFFSNPSAHEKRVRLEGKRRSKGKGEKTITTIYEGHRPSSTGSLTTAYNSLSDKECPSPTQRGSPALSCGAPSPVLCSEQHGRPTWSALPKSARPIWEKIPQACQTPRGVAVRCVSS